jgi:tight adherence protein C
MDAARHPGDAQDDQLQVLGKPGFGIDGFGMDLIRTFTDPTFIVTILASICAFATVLSVAMPILERDRMSHRMRVMAIEREKMRAARVAEMANKERPGARLRQVASKGYMREIVEQLNLREMYDNEELRDRLKRAGLRGQAPVVTYMFFRLAVPIATFALALFYLFVIGDLAYPPMIKIMMALGAAFIGSYLPNVFVENLVQKRQQAIKEVFPDALDMLLICVQAGMSVEAAFARVSREVATQSMELAEELSLTTAELSYLQDRRQAFDNLGRRTGIPGVRAVSTALIQAERYGTPIGQALRVMAKENRDIRQSEAEKKAAALPPKLTVPMIVFFLPVLFVVILGPAALRFWGFA